MGNYLLPLGRSFSKPDYLSLSLLPTPKWGGPKESDKRPLRDTQRETQTRALDMEKNGRTNITSSKVEEKAERVQTRGQLNWPSSLGQAAGQLLLHFLQTLLFPPNLPICPFLHFFNWKTLHFSISPTRQLASSPTRQLYNLAHKASQQSKPSDDASSAITSN